MATATVFLVDLGELDEGPGISELEEECPGITKKLRRGDIIENVSESGYRSNGVYFFNGQDIIDQETDFDDYGSVPLEFKAVSEFPLHYWDKTFEKPHKLVVNNDYASGSEISFYWHSDETLVGIDLTAIKGHFNLPIKDDKNNTILKFIHNDEPYLLVFNGLDIDDIDDNDQMVVYAGDLYYDYDKKLLYSDKYNVPSDNVMFTDY